MHNNVDRLHELLREGKCCAVALVQTALESRNEENEQLLHAVSGLCGGVKSKLLCGALTGAACMMNVLDPKNANAVLVPRLVEWFAETVGGEYGGIDCGDILAGDSRNKAARCPRVIELTYRRAMEIMQENGLEFP